MTSASPETWSVLYPEMTEAPPSAETSVPGESTLADEGGYAFRRATIRKHVAIHHGALDLRTWLSIVPQVHSAFARAGAEKTVALLQASTLRADDALLDAFAFEMAEWAKNNDPALELSVIAVS